MESLTLSQLKAMHPTAFRGLPAKLARAQFISDGTRVSARCDGKVWAWSIRKWVLVMPIHDKDGS